ncbi:MAG: sensor domain-containing diguanylate cyclase [Lachnospiraceae bacterium]|nr:sensor domain-containing diguanylate cyclase [Lachnospiraceae bacterium]
MNAKKVSDKSIISTLILIIFVSCCFVIASVRVNRLAKNACFDTLDDAVAQVADDIRTYVKKDREQLEVIADLLEQCENPDAETVKHYFSSFRRQGIFSAVGLLLPDGNLILETEEENEFENIVDYEGDLSELPCISEVAGTSDNREDKYFYQAVPVEKDGLTVGILYGFVNLADFADSIHVAAFDGNAQLFVADGENGDFLVDTWHDTLGNVFDEKIADRKVKHGYDYQEMKEDFAKGRTGCIAFWSNTAEEYFYSYYKPVGVEKWMVQLTVPESIVFENAFQIRKVIFFFALAEILCFFVFFLWVLSKVRRDTKQKERQLAQSQYMYDVQKILFDAHQDLSLINSALQKVSQMLTAEAAFLMTMKGSETEEMFLSSSLNQEWNNFSGERGMEQLLPQLFKNISSGRNILLYSKEIKEIQNQQDRATLARYRISNLMLVSVLNSSNELVGILGGINMKKRWSDCSLLDCVARSFMMALNNNKSYRRIEQMGIIDLLTGLRNRNCYEHSLGKYTGKEDESICCLYIDANGLHELNNTLGHAAGDEMLMCIGTSLTAFFGPEDSYRIGGDEFAVFCTNCSENEVEKRIAALNERVNSQGYHISIGKAWLKNCGDVKTMISAAENNMYEAKQMYYRKAGNISKARVMNRKLEQILLEKKDADVFLDIMSVRFMGVYVVDMKEDIARTIFKPSYFSNILEENQYHFIPSMKSYVKAYVDADCQKEFLEFLDYDSIQQIFSAQQPVPMIQHFYQKTDGTKLTLSIYPVKNKAYGSDHCHTIWVFEKNYSKAEK